MMDYMSSDIDSRWVFHTNEDSKRVQPERALCDQTGHVSGWNGSSQRFCKSQIRSDLYVPHRHDCKTSYIRFTLFPDLVTWPGFKSAFHEQEVGWEGGGLPAAKGRRFDLNPGQLRWEHSRCALGAWTPGVPHCGILVQRNYSLSTMLRQDTTGFF